MDIVKIAKECLTIINTFASANRKTALSLADKNSKLSAELEKFLNSKDTNLADFTEKLSASLDESGDTNLISVLLTLESL